MRIRKVAMTRRPKIEARYSAVGVKVDALDHPEWLRAQAIQITSKWSGEAAPTSRHAEARMLWTDNSLIVRFLCRQEEPLIINPNPQLNKKTERLWDRDVCEIFIAPDLKAPQHYFEFEAAPTGEWIDLAITLKTTGRETDFHFHSGMTTAVMVDENHVTIAIQIPWSDSLPKPQKGDAWRVNLFRCVGAGDDRYLAWQPTYAPEPNFHVPDAFGWLDFR